MFSAQYTSTEVQPAADHAPFHISRSEEGRLEKSNFLHSPSQPSKSTKEFKRAENININEPDALKVRFGQSTTVIDDLVVIIGGLESLQTEETFPQTLLVLNSTTLIINEQNTNLPVLGHGAVPIRGSRILITFGIQTMAPQKTFAPPIQVLNVNKMDPISFPKYKGDVPQQRYYHTTTKTDDNKIYIHGGINENQVVLGDISYIDLNSNSWNLIEQTSHPIAGHSSISVNNYLISCFGIDVNAKVTNDCSIFDLSTDTFIKPDEINEPPIPRQLSSMVSSENDKNNFYIFGGMDENGNGLNDLYRLDVSNAPTLSWSPININAKTTNEKSIPSGRGAHSAFVIGNIDVMLIWGGKSNENQLADPILYFFDIKGNTWINENVYKEKTTFIQQSNLEADPGLPKSTNVGMIIGILFGVVLILGFVGFFIIRKRKFPKGFRDRDVNNVPYRPDQFGSDVDLINDFETKQIQSKNLDELESTPERTPQLVSIPPSPPTKVEKESEPSDNCQSNDTVMSTATQERMPFGKLQTDRAQTPELLRMKRTHRRTSSVSLTSSELSNLTRCRNFIHHKSSLSASSIINPVSNQSQRSSLKLNALDPVSEKGSELDSPTSRTSVRSLQWVAFNNQENRNALHVRNHSSDQKRWKDRHSSDEDNDGYIIRGDYIDTLSTVKNNYSRNIFDHDEVMTTYDVQQKKNSYFTRNNFSAIPRDEGIAEDVDYTSRESGVIDKFAHMSSSNLNESSNIDRNQLQSNEEDDNSMKRSKRSSKRNSRVSFALKEERIEFDETESSNTVSLARMSGRSSSSSISNSSTPPVIEEENDDI